MKFRISQILSFFLLAALAVGGSACKKDKGSHVLTVTVVVDKGVKVANSLVRLYAPVEGTYIDWYDYTNEQGEIEYSFPNTVVVEIVATKGSFKGCTFAQVDEGSNTKKVRIYPYGTEDNGCTSSSP
ncbi:MAG: hypothetical protein U5L96_01895 [Owenweeksia sp.]|nr:hypothetical protein [Owenweeksia sp.]